jgi:hypothetical protein
MGRSGFGSRIIAVAAALSSGACYIRAYGTPVDPHIRRPPTCANAVALFADPGEVTRTYVALARISIWYPADMIPTPAEEQMAQRKKAAEFGANGLILGHALDQRQSRRATTLAIFIPEDSARAATMCAARRQDGNRLQR